MDNSSQLCWGLVVTQDLIFSTKILGTAQQLGFEMQVAAKPDFAVSRVRETTPRCIILDLGLATLSAEQMRELRAAAPATPIIAFGSHVDAARLADAQNAGCTEVMPRSQFVRVLPQLLERCFRNPE